MTRPSRCGVASHDPDLQARAWEAASKTETPPRLLSAARNRRGTAWPDSKLYTVISLLQPAPANATKQNPTHGPAPPVPARTKRGAWTPASPAGDEVPRPRLRWWGPRGCSRELRLSPSPAAVRTPKLGVLQGLDPVGNASPLETGSSLRASSLPMQQIFFIESLIFQFPHSHSCCASEC